MATNSSVLNGLNFEQLQVHLTLLGWVPVALYHGMTYWGVYHTERGFWREDTANKLGVSRAPLKWVQTYDRWSGGRDIRWDQLPRLVFIRLARAILEDGDARP